SRRLATIRTDLELSVSLAQLTPRAPDAAKLRELYGRLELRGLLRQLDAGESTAPPSVAASAAPAAPQPAPAPAEVSHLEHHYETITSWEAFDWWLTQLHQAELIAFDIETTSLDYMRAEIVGVSFAVAAGTAAYVPLAHAYPGAPDQLPRAEALAKLRPLLEDAARGKVGHNLKYVAHVLAHAGIKLQGMRFDTMLESYVWNSVATSHELDADAQRYLGLRTLSYTDLTGRGAKQISFDQVPVERASEYAAARVHVALRLHGALWSHLAGVPPLA